MTLAATKPTSSSRLAAGSVRIEPVTKSERVTFRTDEKTAIAIVGSYTPPRLEGKNAKAPVVILLHMYNESRKSFDPLVPYLHDAGFAVLAIDLRGHGESLEPAELKLAERMKKRESKLFRDMYRDVEAAYAWLAQRSDVDLARFVLVGASVGCSVALDYASHDPSVDGVVCLTPGKDYLGLDSIADAKKYGRRPLLLLASKKEREAADELGKLVPAAVVKIVPATADDPMASHGTGMFGRVADIEKTITDFLVKAAGPAADNPVVASRKGKAYYEPGSTQAARLSPKNLRWFSSPTEAEARGYRPAKSRSK